MEQKAQTHSYEGDWSLLFSALRKKKKKNILHNISFPRKPRVEPVYRGLQCYHIPFKKLFQ